MSCPAVVPGPRQGGQRFQIEAVLAGELDEYATPASLATEAERLSAAGVAFTLQRFVGGHAIEALRRHGHEVLALVRSEPSAKAVSGFGATPIRGDLDTVVPGRLAP